MLGNTVVPDMVFYIVVAVAILIVVKKHRSKVRHQWAIESSLESIARAIYEQNRSLAMIAERLENIADKMEDKSSKSKD